MEETMTREPTKTPALLRHITILGFIFLAGWLAPSFGQKDDFADYQLRVHCSDPQVANVIFSVKGTGMMGMKVLCAGKCDGKTVSFEEALAGLSAGVTAGFRAELQKHEVKAAAGEAKSIASCGSKCDASTYDDYLRKRQVAMELFKHASELRLTASKLVAERWGAESTNLRIETEKELVGDLAWQQLEPAVKWHLAQRRASLHEAWVIRNTWLGDKAAAVGRTAVAKAPFAVKAWGAVGWVFEAALTTRRGIATAADYADYQREAQEATKKAEEMWRKALEDFEEFMKQKCSESRTVLPDEDRARLERAKAAIEEWDNNQNLYWDPIRNEAVIFSEAIRRANDYLKSGKISLTLSKREFVLAGFAASDDPPDQKSLQAAISELDKAIASWQTLSTSISKYLTNQRSIERKLEDAFGVKATNTDDAKPAKVSPKAEVMPAT